MTPFSVVRLTESLSNEAAKVLSFAFTQDPHTWNNAVNQPRDAFAKWMELEYVPARVKENRSLVALDLSAEGSNRTIIAGVLTIEEMRFGEKHKELDISDQSELTGVHFLTPHLDDMFWKRVPTHYHQTEKCHHGYFSFIAASVSHQRMGVATTLILAGVEDCRTKGCVYCVAHCESLASAATFAKAGFESWGYIDYSTFRVVDELPFKSLPDGATVMVLKLI